MKKIYIRTDDNRTRLEDGDGRTIEASPATIAAAKRGTITNALRLEVGAALNEECLLVDKTEAI